MREMTALVHSIPYVTRATLRAERFQLERCIDRIGELEKIEGKGDDQIASLLDRLLDDRKRDVQGAQHPRDGLLRIADQQTDVVPALRQFIRRRLLQYL